MSLIQTNFEVRAEAERAARQAAEEELRRLRERLGPQGS